MAAYFLLLVSWLTIFLPPGLPQAQTEEPVVIVIASPEQGEPLQGNVSITGTIRAPGFIEGRLEFSYEDDNRDSWFEINRLALPREETELGLWDTTILTDGNYTLRLSVTVVSGEVITNTVTGLRVRNYSIIETSTPAPTDTPQPDAAPTLSHTPTPTSTRIPPTATLLPANPGELTPSQLSRSAGRGILIT
ncbi:MAG: hypothetical protein R3335_02145, partial [Anaerolineales bacterium]|nr:hypothetical protein [Anaerolineales bacterium]